jgi:hypothetical protein
MFRDTAPSQQEKHYQVSKERIAFFFRIKSWKRNVHPSRGKHHALSKRRWLFTSQHGVTTQKLGILQHTRFNVLNCLSAFEKLRKATVTIVMSLRLSVWNLIFEGFAKTCQENSSFIKIWQEYRVVYTKTDISFWSNYAHFYIEWTIFQTKVVEEIKTRILLSTFFENRDHIERM